MQKIFQSLILFLCLITMAGIVFLDAPAYLVFLLFVLIIIAALTSGAKQNQFEYLQRILATSKINAVASGLAEIVGVPRPYGDLATSPIGKLSCVGFIYTIEEKRVSKNSNGQEQVKYVEIKREIQCDRFYLQDESGRIEIDTKGLSWFGFQPINQYYSGSYRYREYILDENNEVLMIGQAWYADNKPIFKYSQDKQILAMAPLNWLRFRNKWRPLKFRIGFMFAIFSLFIVVILLVPIHLDGTKLILDISNMAKTQ